MGFADWFFSFIHRVKLFPLIIQITIVLTFAFIIATFLFVIIIYRIRRKHNRLQKKLSKTVPKIRSLFEDVLFTDMEISEKETYNKFKDIVRVVNYDALDIAVDIMVDFKNENKKSDKYPFLIKTLNIIEHLENKFESSSHREKMDAFQESYVLDIDKLDSQVLNHAYSKNSRIRSEARNSNLALSSNDPYRFFDEFDVSLTKWDEIKLMEYLKLQRSKGNLEDLGKWINYSKNASLVVFLIKMVGFFKQKGLEEILLEKLEDSNENVRAEAILTLGQLNINNTEQNLIDRYYTEPEICEIAIIKTIKKFNTGKSLNFLEEIFKETNNTDKKKLIAEVLLNYGYEGKIAFQNLKSSLKGFDLTILKHVESPLIKFK